MFIISKVRRVDLYKVYLDNKDRSYVCQFFANEEDIYEMSKNMQLTGDAKYTLKLEDGEKKIFKGTNINSLELIGSFPESYDEKEMGADIQKYIESVRIERNAE